MDSGPWSLCTLRLLPETGLTAECGKEAVMRRWSAALAATVTLIGLALLLFGCGDDDDEGTVLATTEAGPIPEQAACPEGAEPDTPGPADQQRPQGSGAVDAAAFDGSAEEGWVGTEPQSGLLLEPEPRLIEFDS